MIKAEPKIMRQRQIFLVNGAWTIGQPFGRKITLGPYLTPNTRIHFKWMSDPDVRK